MENPNYISSTIVLSPPDRLIPHDRNPRTHSQADSVRLYGFTTPVLVDADGVIIASHVRLLAALAAGRTLVPVIVLRHLTDADGDVK